MTTLVDTQHDLFEYFRLRVAEAREDTRVPLTDDAALYLAQLLAERARVDRDAPEAHTLAELHLTAAGQRPAEQARTYRELGDRALYDLAFFGERLERSIVSRGYYADMGSAAYQRVDDVLKRWFSDAFGQLFGELAARFRACVDVITTVRGAHDGDDLGALYAEWLASGDEDLAAQLRRRGLVIPRTPPAGDDPPA